jgi:hypothetical protein
MDRFIRGNHEKSDSNLWNDCLEKQRHCTQNSDTSAGGLSEERCNGAAEFVPSTNVDRQSCFYCSRVLRHGHVSTLCFSDFSHKVYNSLNPVQVTLISHLSRKCKNINRLIHHTFILINISSSQYIILLLSGIL